MKPKADVDKLYATAFGQLDYVGRYLDEWTQLHGSKEDPGNGKGNGKDADEDHACAEADSSADEDEDGFVDTAELPVIPEAKRDPSELPPVVEVDDSEWEEQ